mmetsp:Transcript_13505/g.29640  ORF Transcript_13505/g.29640 Transcript_13505/m.29640 type:complete len:364 (+) Transcript_13505:44-1135(+)
MANVSGLTLLAAVVTAAGLHVPSRPPARQAPSLNDPAANTAAIFNFEYYADKQVQAQQLAAQQGLPAPPLQEVVLADPFLVRYAVLNPSQSTEYLQQTGLPMLRSTLCLLEKNLAPGLLHDLGTLPTYVIYTDNFSHEAVKLLMSDIPAIQNRINLINLDLDEEDVSRMAPFSSLQLDDVDAASVRRTLADAKYLPSNYARLLLGTDISFLNAPVGLLQEIVSLKPGQAMYMLDDKIVGEGYYKIPGFAGPQCQGLLGDFVYLTPSVHLTAENLVSKMTWYATQPLDSERVSPQCALCDDPARSRGLHAIDQFGMAMALGEAVHGAENCFILGTTYYGNLPAAEVRSSLEGAHDRIISNCVAT